MNLDKVYLLGEPISNYPAAVMELKSIWASIDDQEKDEMLNYLKNNTANSVVELIYNLPIFLAFEIRDEFQSNKLQGDVERVKSEKPCPNCGKHALYYREIQSRSGDEAMSVQEKCGNCGYSKRYR